MRRLQEEAQKNKRITRIVNCSSSAIDDVVTGSSELSATSNYFLLAVIFDSIFTKWISLKISLQVPSHNVDGFFRVKRIQINGLGVNCPQIMYNMSRILFFSVAMLIHSFSAQARFPPIPKEISIPWFFRWSKSFVHISFTDLFCMLIFSIKKVHAVEFSDIAKRNFYRYYIPRNIENNPL